MTALYYLLGVVIFVVAILASIGLHELGHMIPAKKFGGKVTQYFIGFGPTVWSKQVGETEYGVKAIPLGGYVKIVGMLPPGAEELADEVTDDAQGNQVVRVRKSNTGMFTQLISDARAAEWETIRPEDADRLFYKMAVVEEGHRDGRRADGEPPDRVRHLPRGLRHLRQPQRRPDLPGRRPGRGLRGPRGRGRPGLHRRGPGQPRGQGRAAGRATGSSPSTAPAITDWKQLQDLIRGNDARHGRRSPSSATAAPRSCTTNTIVDARGRPRRPTRRSSRSASSGVTPVSSVRHRWPGLHPRADGRR